MSIKKSTLTQKRALLRDDEANVGCVYEFGLSFFLSWCNYTAPPRILTHPTPPRNHPTGFAATGSVFVKTDTKRNRPYTRTPHTATHTHTATCTPQHTPQHTHRNTHTTTHTATHTHTTNTTHTTHTTHHRNTVAGDGRVTLMKGHAALDAARRRNEKGREEKGHRE